MRKIYVTNCHDSGSGSLRDAIKISNHDFIPGKEHSITKIVIKESCRGDIILTSGELLVTSNIILSYQNKSKNTDKKDNDRNDNDRNHNDKKHDDKKHGDRKHDDRKHGDEKDTDRKKIISINNRIFNVQRPSSLFKLKNITLIGSIFNDPELSTIKDQVKEQIKQLKKQIKKQIKEQISKSAEDKLEEEKVQADKLERSLQTKDSNDEDVVILRYGGAIFVNTAPHQLIGINITIENSRAISGGGIYTRGSLLLIQSKIINNLAFNQGGGIYAGGDITLYRTKVNYNTVLFPLSSSGGGGIFINDGNLVASDCTEINYNQISIYNGSGGAINVLSGNITIEKSKVDFNTGYNSAGIQEGVGNVYIIHSSVSHNTGTNDNVASGGGGINITVGTVYVSNSQINNNRTKGMFSGGIVSLLGSVMINDSELNFNSNNGPGGAIACNFEGQINITRSKLIGNVAASMGGAITNFSLKFGSIIIQDHTVIKDNQLTNGQTIGESLEVFLSIIIRSLIQSNDQANLSGGSGAIKLKLALLSVFEKAISTNIVLQAILNRGLITDSHNDQHEDIDHISDIINNINNTKDYKITERQSNKITKGITKEQRNGRRIGDAIGGGAISSLITCPIIIDKSKISNNFVGRQVLDRPFFAIGGGLFAYLSSITLTQSDIDNNTSFNSGGGIWVGSNLSDDSYLNCNESCISHNQVTGFQHTDNNDNRKAAASRDDSKYTRASVKHDSDSNSDDSDKALDGIRIIDGGGIYALNAKSTLIKSIVTNNQAIGSGGGINNQNGNLTLISTKVVNNKASFENNIYSNVPYVDY